MAEAAQRPGATESAKEEAFKGIQALADYTTKEANIENRVTAKGYRDCVALMEEDNVTVIVSTKGDSLQAEDVARIADIAMAETGFPASGVEIVSAD